VVRAQSEDIYPIIFGPSRVTTADGSVFAGNVVLDLRNGNLWGFPLFAPPTSTFDKSLPVAHPVLIGRFALEELNKK
jgi:hypothetical protein